MPPPEPWGRAMRRRQFLSVLAGAGASAYPLAARAQQPMPVIGMLSSRTLDLNGPLVAAFRRGLAENGYAEGRRCGSTTGPQAITLGCRRWPPELVRRPLNVIVSVGGEPTALAVKAATSTISKVTIIGSDPVVLGLAGSDSRPGGNTTGVNIMTGLAETKRLGLLRELVPKANSIGVLLNPGNPLALGQMKDIEKAAQAIKLPVQVLQARTEREIDASFDIIAQQRISALLVEADPFLPSMPTDYSAGGAPARADDVSVPRVCASRGPCELWHPASRRLSSGRRLCRAYPQGGCAR